MDISILYTYTLFLLQILQAVSMGFVGILHHYVRNTLDQNIWEVRWRCVGIETKGNNAFKMKQQMLPDNKMYADHAMLCWPWNTGGASGYWPLGVWQQTSVCHKWAWWRCDQHESWEQWRKWDSGWEGGGRWPPVTSSSLEGRGSGKPLLCKLSSMDPSKRYWWSNSTSLELSTYLPSSTTGILLLHFPWIPEEGV